MTQDILDASLMQCDLQFIALSTGRGSACLMSSTPPNLMEAPKANPFSTCVPGKRGLWLLYKKAHLLCESTVCFCIRYKKTCFICLCLSTLHVGALYTRKHNVEIVTNFLVSTRMIS